jgi:hypothetical protein
MSRDVYPKYSLPSGGWTTYKERADLLWARHNDGRPGPGCQVEGFCPLHPQALAWVQMMAATIADDQERALVEQVIETVTEGRKLPSWQVMTPLMRVAALALQGKTRPWEPARPRCAACGGEAREGGQCMSCLSELCEDDARRGPSGDLFCAGPRACEARYAAAHPRP